MYGLGKTLGMKLGFESFVNSEESKTIARSGGSGSCLRALLIQKKVKQGVDTLARLIGLRALLIQKKVKR